MLKSTAANNFSQRNAIFISTVELLTHLLNYNEYGVNTNFDLLLWIVSENEIYGGKRTRGMVTTKTSKIRK